MIHNLDIRQASSSLGEAGSRGHYADSCCVWGRQDSTQRTSLLWKFSKHTCNGSGIKIILKSVQLYKFLRDAEHYCLEGSFFFILRISFLYNTYGSFQMTTSHNSYPSSKSLISWLAFSIHLECSSMVLCPYCFQLNCSTTIVHEQITTVFLKEYLCK